MYKFNFITWYFSEKPATYNMDHIYPQSKDKEPIAILYGELGTPSFKQFHQVLSKAAEKGEVCYILRHYTKVNYHF